MNISSTAFPKYATQIMSLKRIWGGLVAVFLFIGIFAAADAFYSSWKLGSDNLRLVAGESLVVKDVVPPGACSTTGAEAIITPDNDGVSASEVKFLRNPDSDAHTYTFSIASTRRVSLGSYSIDVLFTDEAGQPTASKKYSLSLFAGKQHLHSASPSVIEQLLEVDPSELAAKTLFLSLVFAIFFSPGTKLIEAYIIKRGYCRIQNTFVQGDVTLLYCRLPRSFELESNAYPVLSASGSLLGLASLSERGSTYGVFTLESINATPGCYIFLKDAA